MMEGEHNPLLNAIAARGHRAKLPLRVVVVDQPFGDLSLDV